MNKSPTLPYLLKLADSLNTEIRTTVSYERSNGSYIFDRNLIELEIKSPKPWYLFFCEAFWNYSWNNKTQSFPKFIWSNEDLITLAHELGHAFSDAKGYNRPQELLIANLKFKLGYNLTYKDKQRIFIDEKRAWAFARIFLKKTNFNNWTEFSEIKLRCLNSYRQALNLD